MRWVLFAALTSALLLGAACSDDANLAATAGSTGAAGQGTTAAQEQRPMPTAQAGEPTLQDPGRAAKGDATPDAEIAYRHIERLTVDIGDRVSGTPEERAAAEYIAGVLRGYGYEVEMQRFPVSAFVTRSVSLDVASPRREKLNPQALTNSRAGTASGEIVSVGAGRPSDFTEAVRGKIALAQRDGQTTHAQRAQSAAAAGATALVIYNNGDDIFLGDLGRSGSSIPVLSLSGREGQALRELIEAGPVRATLAFEGGQQESESINVIARSSGTPCRALLGGHYDSVAEGRGASDNANGTAAVIEMARVQALRGNPEGACFAAFGSEETGLEGSRYLVRNLRPEDRQALRFMLNFDMLAVGTEWLLIGTPALQQAGRQVLQGMGLDGRATTLLGASSDHASFIDGGIPALFLHRSPDSLLHTPQDTIERLSKEQLAEGMRIGLAFLEGFANG